MKCHPKEWSAIKKLISKSYSYDVLLDIELIDYLLIVRPDGRGAHPSDSINRLSP